MKRLAIFVEGQTEQLFVTKLLREIAGENCITINNEKYVNKNGMRLITSIDAASVENERKFYVIIRDCGGDSCVKSDIIDGCEKLSMAGYEKIIGLLDVYPKTRNEIQKYELGLKYGVPTKYIPINIVLAVMEIEAWFLGEASHFNKIHPDLTRERIVSTFGFDPFTENMEIRNHPADDLNDIYKLVGFAYNKKKQNTLRTVNSLDYNRLYIEQQEKMESLENLIAQIDSFLT